MNYQESILSSLEAVGAERGVIYLSTPLSSGEREIVLLERLGLTRQEFRRLHPDLWDKEVWKPNVKDADRFAAAIRQRHPHRLVVNPARLEVAGWSQSEYNDFWAAVIRKFARLIIIAPGWALSRGCRHEVAAAREVRLPMSTVDDLQVDDDQVLAADREAWERVERSAMHPVDVATYLGVRLAYWPSGPDAVGAGSSDLHFKDAILDELARGANVAQFVSFGPGQAPKQRYSRVKGFLANHPFNSLDEAIRALLERTVEHSVNIRSFDPAQPKGQEFVYGIKSATDALAAASRLAQQGLYVIVNETIDIHDGGVSGVVHGDLCEFAPEDTPRCVEKPGTASFPRSIALRLFKIVYGFTPLLDYSQEYRVEFSLHPVRRGVLDDHTVVWEAERLTPPPGSLPITWPNRFSRFIGDKAFGLLVAALVGVSVPETTVISRTLAPFRFGRPTGASEIWLRTCPREQVPGRFTTQRGWADPFRLMDAEDPGGTSIASILAQQEVPARYSGALATREDGTVLIEGVAGYGDRFMLGEARPTDLPKNVANKVKELHKQLTRALGPVRMEWVYDGALAWVVQLHSGVTGGSGSTIVDGQPSRLHHFNVSDGIERLRQLVTAIDGSGEGVVLVGDVGLTSHFGDILRKARIPSWIERRPTEGESTQASPEQLAESAKAPKTPAS